MNQLSTNIKAYRKAHNLNQSELAERLNVSQTSVAHYESGSRTPTLDVLIQIADLFDTSVDTLLGHTRREVSPIPIIDLEAVELQLFQLLVEKKYFAFHQMMKQLSVQFSLLEMIDEIVRGVQSNIGEAWEKGEITVADEHYATGAISRTMAALFPLDQRVLGKKKAIALSIGSEEHTLSIELVSNFLQANGIDTQYLGKQVPIDSLNQMIKVFEPDYLFLSITLREQVNSLELLVKGLEKKEEPTKQEKLKIVVGGQGVKYLDTKWIKSNQIEVVSEMSHLISMINVTG